MLMVEEEVVGEAAGEVEVVAGGGGSGILKPLTSCAERCIESERESPGSQLGIFRLRSGVCWELTGSVCAFDNGQKSTMHNTTPEIPRALLRT